MQLEQSVTGTRVQSIPSARYALHYNQAYISQESVVAYQVGASRRFAKEYKILGNRVRDLQAIFISPPFEKTAANKQGPFSPFLGPSKPHNLLPLTGS